MRVHILTTLIQERRVTGTVQILTKISGGPVPGQRLFGIFYVEPVSFHYRSELIFSRPLGTKSTSGHDLGEEVGEMLVLDIVRPVADVVVELGGRTAFFH